MDGICEELECGYARESAIEERSWLSLLISILY